MATLVDLSSLGLVDTLNMKQLRVHALASVLLDIFVEDRCLAGELSADGAGELLSLIQDVADQSCEINAELWRRMRALESASA